MRRAVAFLHDGWARGRVAFVVVAVVILGLVSVQQGRWLWPKITEVKEKIDRRPRGFVSLKDAA